MSADEEAQQEEVLAMESILDGNVFQLYSHSEAGIRSGQIKIRIDLPDPFYVGDANEEFQKQTDDEERVGVGARYKVEYMPPLTVHFELPLDYPSKTKPNFTLSSSWLHRVSLSVLCQKLDQLWEENKGMGILFTWSNYLQANTLSDLGIQDYYDVRWLHQPHKLSPKQSYNEGVAFSSNIAVTLPSASASVATEISDASASPKDYDYFSVQDPTKLGKTKTGRFLIDQRAALEPIFMPGQKKKLTLTEFLLAYNDEQIQDIFQQSTHSCDICLSMKVGHSCLRFHCGHVFCVDCTTSCFTTHITEGSVDQVKCPAFNCKIYPTPEMVRRCVGETLYQRYDELLLKRALENMSDVMYCPRPMCQSPVISEPSEKCLSCTVCGYTFCGTCKMVYHGVEPCDYKDKIKAICSPSMTEVDVEEMFYKFTQGTATYSEKDTLLKIYGRKQLQKRAETVLSEEWIQKESKKCPRCKAPIEKFEGCNKVACFKCGTLFCWLCLRPLDPKDPYRHFKYTGSPCYNNLFQNMYPEQAGDAAGAEVQLFEAWEVDYDYDEDDAIEGGDLVANNNGDGHE